MSGSWAGDGAIASGQTHEGGRNRRSGASSLDGNCAARRASPFTRVSLRDASEKDDGHGHHPCEDSRARSSGPVRRGWLQKSSGSILASKKLARSAPKRVAVRVNGGLARREAWGESPADHAERNGWAGEPVLTRAEWRAGSAETQSGTRVPFGGRLVTRKGGVVVAGPGL